MKTIKENSVKILSSTLLLTLGLNAFGENAFPKYAREDVYVDYGEGSYEEQYQPASLAGITLGEDISTACPKFENILKQNNKNLDKKNLDKKNSECSTFIMFNGGLTFDNNGKVTGIIILNEFLGFNFLTPAEDVAHSYLNSGKSIDAEFKIKTERLKSGNIEKIIYGVDKNNQKVEISNYSIHLQKLNSGRF